MFRGYTVAPKGTGNRAVFRSNTVLSINEVSLNMNVRKGSFSFTRRHLSLDASLVNNIVSDRSVPRFSGVESVKWREILLVHNFDCVGV